MFDSCRNFRKLMFTFKNKKMLDKIVSRLKNRLNKQSKSSQKNQTVNCEFGNGYDMPGDENNYRKKVRKKFRKRDDRDFWLIKLVLNRLRLRHFDALDISMPEPHFNVIYLGNIVTSWSKDETCLEKPISILSKNRNMCRSRRNDVEMTMKIGKNGLQVQTKQYGQTDYWANRITYCCNPTNHPKLFCWIYRHESKQSRQELRCHAVICETRLVAAELERQLRATLKQLLADFKKEKMMRQKARLSCRNNSSSGSSIVDAATLLVPLPPKRKILLCKSNVCHYKRPLERSKSAPRLTIIEELLAEDDESDSDDHHDDDNGNNSRHQVLKRLQTCPELDTKMVTAALATLSESGEDSDRLSEESGYVDLSDSEVATTQTKS